MTHPYTLARLRQQSAIEQFHADHDRTARRSVASFDHADVAPSIVAKPETRSKAALRESGPLADGFELAGSHSGIPGQLVVAVKPELTLLVQAERDGILSAEALNALVVIPEVLAAHNVGFNQRVPATLASYLGDALGHFHSPVSGGASLRCTDNRYIVPQAQAKNAGSANLFHTLAYRERI